jgi:hypothetical protein
MAGKVVITVSGARIGSGPDLTTLGRRLGAHSAPKNAICVIADKRFTLSSGSINAKMR